MAKRHGDPVLERLVHAVEQSPAAAVPVAVSVRGTRLRGELISQDAYFAELASGGALLGALGAEAVGGSDKEFDKKSADGFVHLRGAATAESAPGAVWRIAVGAVDAWSLLAGREELAREHEDKGGGIGSIFGRDPER